MGRVKLQLPEAFPFSTELTIRVTDINYGGHLGNDSLLSLLHEARVRFLRSHGWSELDIEGCGVMMVDAELVFSSEGFVGERIVAEVAPCNASRCGCEIFYRLTKQESGEELARGKTGMVFFDYQKRRPLRTPDAFKALCAG